MKRSLRLNAAASLAGLRARFERKSEKLEDRGLLRLTVSEQGWQATLQLPNEPEQQTAEAWVDANVPVTTVEAIRRAVRAISRAQRERIGSVRLVVADPAIFLIDNRSVRIKSTDPAVIAQAGSQELGVDAVLYGFMPFGQSSEFEVPRGVYAFIPLAQVREYMIALESLAPLLTELVPVPLLELADAATDAVALFELRSSGATLLLADPDTGTVLCRDFACGRGALTSAIAEATSISLREAADGLQRRVCFQPEAGWHGASTPMTATERALSPLLSTLKGELSDWLEHFIHHRLANAPVRVAIKGQASHVRGFSEWIAHALGVPTQDAADPHQRIFETSEASSLNLLHTAPLGLLTIGKTEYRFIDGRFQSEQSQPIRRKAATEHPVGLAPIKRALAMVRSRRTGILAGVAIASVFALWLTVGEFSSPLAQAAAAFADAQAEDTAVREALLRRSRAGPPAAREPALEWFDRLVTIANAVPKGIRLAHVSVSGASATDDKLMIDGDVVPTDNSLAEISGMIDQLSGTPSFMRDFGAINFGGAEATSAGGLLHFSVDMNLTKRAKSAERPGRSG